MDTTLVMLGWPELLHHYSAAARTPAGARAVLDLPLFDDLAEVRAAYATVDEVLAVELTGERVPVGGVGDIASLVDRAGRGTTLEGIDLRAIASTLDALRFLKRWLADRATDLPRVWAMAVDIDVDEDLTDVLRRSFDPAGELSGDEYPVLDELRRRITTFKGRIQSTLDDILRSDAMGGILQDRYYTERNGRFVVPVKASFRRGLGIVHGTSQSGETVYVEPSAVVEVHNDLKEAEAALQHEERRILSELTRRVAGRRTEITASLDSALRIDLVCARVGLGRALRGRTPDVGNEGVLVIHEGRHPLLQLAGVDVIPNDLSLTPANPALVLTGPNAGGKTIALKSIGLFALLVRAAIPLPCAEHTRVDLCTPILADIGDMQSVADGLSTFSAHVKGLGIAVAQARPGALVLIDEITSGTDPAQGAALARAVMESLVESGARVAVTTHFPELKTLSVSDPRFSVSAAEFAEGRPTFRIQSGVPGPSHALAIARRMGLPERVLDRALAVMDTNQRELAERLEKLEAERAAVRTLQEATRMKLDAVERREHKLAEAEARLATQGRKAQEEATERHKGKLRKLEEELRALVASLQANPDPRAANAALATVRASRVASDPAPAPPPPPVPHAVGDRVRLRSFGQVAKVRSIAADGRLELDIGNLRSWVTPDAVDALSGKERRSAERKDQKASQALHEAPERPPARVRETDQQRRDDPELRNAALRMDFNTVDLRGMRVDEATAATEAFFDARSLAGIRTLFVLHGHGTGALKTAMRAWLPQSRYVRTSRPADADEGGDAYTVVELK